MPDEIIIKRAYRGSRNKDKKKRQMNPNSLKNLNPIKPGEVRNTTGVNGRSRLYTQEYQLTGESVTPEQVRVVLNIKLHLQLKQIRDAARVAELPAAMVKAIEKQMKQEFIPQGMIWAQACAIRMHMNAVLEGDVNAMTEVRESVEGRATQRIEFNNTNDKLEQLLDEFELARKNVKPPDPESK